MSETPLAISLTVEDTPEVTPDTMSEITEEDAAPGAPGDAVPGDVVSPTLPLQDASSERQIIVTAMGRIYFFKTKPSRIFLHVINCALLYFLKRVAKYTWEGKRL